MKNQAVTSESRDPAALVSVVSLKCVLRLAVRLLGRAGWNSRLKFVVFLLTSDGQYRNSAAATCTADAIDERRLAPPDDIVFLVSIQVLTTLYVGLPLEN